MMLSRVAEKLYWMARYLERAEDTARLINAITIAQLDLPASASFGWDTLLRVAGLHPGFRAHYEEADENSVLSFLIHDERNPSAILSCLSHARENCRTLREVVPREFFHWLNETHLYARAHLPVAVNRRRRFDVLEEIIHRRHAQIGLLYSCMSHDEAFQLMRIGRNLERADMTSRVLDVSHAILLPREESAGAYIDLLWISVLKALSAYQMFRRHVSAHTRGPGVIRFLLRDRMFPRSVCKCLEEIGAALEELPNPGVLQAEVEHSQAKLARANETALYQGNLHGFIDALQLDLMQLHQTLSHQYFRFEPGADGCRTQTQLQFG